LLSSAFNACAQSSERNLTGTMLDLRFGMWSAVAATA
jgi:hypothetical protein